MTCRWFKSWNKEIDEAGSDVKKISEALLDGESNTNSALQREVRKFEDNHQKGEEVQEVSSLQV